MQLDPSLLMLPHAALLKFAEVRMKKEDTYEAAKEMIRTLSKRNGGDVRVPVWIQKCRIIKSQLVEFFRIELGRYRKCNTNTSLPFFGVNLSSVCLMFAYRKTRSTRPIDAKL